MKNVLVIAAIILSPMLMAQSNVEEVEYIQSIFGMEKKDMMSQFIKLEGTAKDAFWSLYDQYEVERKALGKTRVDLISDYVESYEDLTDEKADELVAASYKLNTSISKLINKYYKKMKKESGTKAASQFYQMENYIASVIRVQIFSNIPLIGEFEMKGMK